MKTRKINRFIAIGILIGMVSTPFIAHHSKEGIKKRDIEVTKKQVVTTPREKKSIPSSPTPKPTSEPDIDVAPKKTVKPTIKPTKKPIKKKIEKKSEKRDYTEDEFYLMSHLLYGEAGDSDWDEMVKVGSVALNRVSHENYPNTLRKVIYQRGQYACTWDGNFDKKPSKLAKKVARYLLENGSQIPKDVVFQADFIQGSGVWEHTRHHYYCYY